MRNHIILVVCFIATALYALQFTNSASGGVLIGQLPEQGGADIRNIKWTIEGDSVQIVLVAANADGKLIEHSLKPVSIDIVRQALRYAADGRPLTVTMIKADPLPDLKILLHPALVDSHLGRSAIRLDQLVDQFAGGRSLVERGQIYTRIRSQDSLYKLAWAARLKPVLEFQSAALADATENKVRKQVDDQIRAFSLVVERYLADDDLRRRAEFAIRQTRLLKDEGSFLRTNHEYYDAELVDLLCTFKPKVELGAILDGASSLVAQKIEEVAQFATKERKLNADIIDYNSDLRRLKGGVMGGTPGVTRERNVQDLIRRLREQREMDATEPLLFPPVDNFDRLGDIGTLPGVGKVDPASLARRRVDIEKRQKELNREARSVKKSQESLGQAYARPPEFIEWSGVRERDFTGEISDYLEPKRPEQLFRFMVQVAFTSRPMFLEGESAADYSDETPYEYTEIEEKVNRNVADGIKRDRDASQAVEEMAAFTQLQRLFRAAIAGKVGEQFPEERLTDLARALGSRDPEQESVRTPRWLPKPGRLEVIAMVKIALAAEVKNADVEALQEPNLDDDDVRSRLRELTEAQLTRMKNSDDEHERKAGDAMLQCFHLLDETFTAHREFLKKATTSDSDREEAREVFLAEQEAWLKRWSEAATMLEVDASSPQSFKSAANTLAQIDYSVQARIRMQVMDDERHSDILLRNVSDNSR